MNPMLGYELSTQRQLDARRQADVIHAVRLYRAEERAMRRAERLQRRSLRSAARRAARLA